MISSNLFDALYKTLNYSEQQYKETEEIVEQNPRILLFGNISNNYNRNLTSTNNAKTECDVSCTVSVFKQNGEQPLDKLGVGYTNEAFEKDLDDHKSNLSR